MFHTVSVLPIGLENQIQQIPSVTQVSAAINSPTNIQINGNDQTVGVIAYDISTGLLGPPKIVEGRQVTKTGEVVIDSLS